MQWSFNYSERNKSEEDVDRLGRRETTVTDGKMSFSLLLPRDCAGGDIPDAVPIAVGCALGGMVVVVLIAYLVARRRSAARGYLSM
ncbi:hypothetical protein MSG28_001931 [Choristoneura fumiferana]|uniref:Uncharacterized protein n=1 Tax=Choristoneura fumiferana TaxID=7141 RepID=A0ACC0JT62_CHOFU|nr:hypothetical protein MSG28_001931 [Choristoneura fumiferana]